MNKKTYVLLLALGLTQFGGMAVAEPGQNIWTPLNKICLQHNGTIYPSVAAPGEKKAVYGPYTAKCPTSYHKFQLNVVPVVVEKLTNGIWIQVQTNPYSPVGQFGAGTFRVMLDNQTGLTPVSYRGTFSVPL